MSDDDPSDMADLHERIKSGDYKIEIKETRHGSIVALNKGEERTVSPEEHAELRDLMNEYKQLILDLNEAYEEHSNNRLERAWAMGKIYKQEVEVSEQRAFSKLTPMLPFVDSQNRNHYLYRAFYEMFPDKGWNENHNLSMLTEFAQRAGPKEAREIYDRTLSDYDKGTTKQEVRWAYEEDYPAELESIVQKLQKELDSPTGENVEHIFRLRGVDDRPTEEEIQSAFDEG